MRARIANPRYWAVDIINIATPQRDDTQTNRKGYGKYINFYNNSDMVQYLGSQNYYSDGEKRKDSKAQVNKEITTSENWFSISGGHSYHQDSAAQMQMLNAIIRLF